MRRHARRVLPLFNAAEQIAVVIVKRNILVIGSANKKMITGKDSIRSAGMVIAYMVMGNQMTRSEVDDVRQIIRNARNDDSAALPRMIP